MVNDIYQFSILNTKKWFWCLIIYAGFGFFFLYVANGIYENRFFSVVILVALVGPFLFLDFFRKFFIFQGHLKISSDGFLVELQKPNVVEEINLAFKDIQKYTISFPSSEFYVIKFILTDDRKIKFSFIDFAKVDNITSSSEIISLLNKSIKDYNHASGGKRIVYKFSFIASKRGLIALSAMVVLLAIAISLHIITKQYQTIPVSLICGFLLLMRSSSQRKIDLNYYDENIVNVSSD